MERIELNKLVTWKMSRERKSMILKGARQIGKTWLMLEFGKRYYKNTVYYNFDEEDIEKLLFCCRMDRK
ncbi:MAG: AAA family ATPase [Oliverpabstia sp.]